MVPTLWFSAGIFAVMALFFGFIGYSVFFRRKPVIVMSRWLVVLIALTLVPSLVLPLVSGPFPSDLLWVTLLSSGAMVFLLLFLAYLMKGFSVYGLGGEDFRRLLTEGLRSLGEEPEEQLGRFVLKARNTEVAVTFQDRMGIGQVRSKHPRRFPIGPLLKSFQAAVAQGEVQTVAAAGWFYGGFAVLMAGFAGAMVYLNQLKP